MFWYHLIVFHGSLLSSHRHHHHSCNARIDDHEETEQANGIYACRYSERLTVAPKHVALGDRAGWLADNVSTRAMVVFTKAIMDAACALGSFHIRAEEVSYNLNASPRWIARPVDRHLPPCVSYQKKSPSQVRTIPHLFMTPMVTKSIRLSRLERCPLRMG